MIETIGKRIAALRNKKGWTQQYLAERAAISRVAVSHIEMDLTIPGERTITLLAGIFKKNPLELVEGTTYPQAKTDRLPFITCTYTSLEHKIGLLKNDLKWLERIRGLPGSQEMLLKISQEWIKSLQAMDSEMFDLEERKLVSEAIRLISGA